MHLICQTTFCLYPQIHKNGVILTWIFCELVLEKLRIPRTSLPLKMIGHPETYILSNLLVNVISVERRVSGKEGRTGRAKNYLSKQTINLFMLITICPFNYVQKSNSYVNFLSKARVINAKK